MMMSRQQNLPTVSQSLPQQTGSEADVKTFSIRQYVLASRHKNILHNWPFPEKYLQMCLNHGLREVLPPFGRQTSLADQSLKGFSELIHSQNNDSKEADFCKPEVPSLNIKDECEYKVTNNHNRECPSSLEEGNQHDCSVSATLLDTSHVHKSSQLLPSSKAVKDKRKRGRGRCKKRSMVDILAVARHCTSEEINRINKFCYAETVIERFQQTVPFENFSKSELGAHDDSCKKAAREDHGVANIDMPGKGPLLLKFKLNGCNVML